MQLTVVELDASATRVAGTTACPVLAATLLPDWDSSNSSSEDGCGGDEVLHDGEIGTLIEVFESLTCCYHNQGQADALLYTFRATALRYFRPKSQPYPRSDGPRRLRVGLSRRLHSNRPSAVREDDFF